MRRCEIRELLVRHGKAVHAITMQSHWRVMIYAHFTVCHSCILTTTIIRQSVRGTDVVARFVLEWAPGKGRAVINQLIACISSRVTRCKRPHAFQFVSGNLCDNVSDALVKKFLLVSISAALQRLRLCILKGFLKPFFELKYRQTPFSSRDVCLSVTRLRCCRA